MSGRIISSRSHLSLSSSGGGGGSATGRPAGPYYPSIPMVTISTTTVSLFIKYKYFMLCLCLCVYTTLYVFPAASLFSFYTYC